MKIISLPGSHDINIAPIQPIIDHPLFQNLRGRKQLGAINLLFPSANHTRFEHSLGCYSLTQDITRKLLSYKSVNRPWLNEQIAKDTCLVGLLHDIGHGPYSHQTESLCSKDHKDVGLERLACLKSEIEQCGGNYENIVEIFTKKHPVSQCISHHPLGTDKLDYLTRDARHTNESIKLSLGQILNYISFFENELAIDIKVIHEVMQAQRDYIYMYNRVYLRKGCMIVERYLQKIIAILLADHSDPLTEEKLWQMIDSEIDASLINSINPVVQEMRSNITQRNLPRVAMSFRPKKFLTQERIAGKPIQLFPLEEDRLMLFGKYSRPQDSFQVEQQIARIADIDPKSVVFIPTTHSYRFTQKDIIVRDWHDKIGTLKGLFPSHYEALAELARSYISVRVCVDEEYRQHIFSHKISREIKDYLYQLIS